MLLPQVSPAELLCELYHVTDAITSFANEVYFCYDYIYIYKS